MIAARSGFSSNNVRTIGGAGTSPIGSSGSLSGSDRSRLAAASAAKLRRASRSRGRRSSPCARNRLLTPIAVMLSPPRAKKSSSTATRSTPITSAIAAHNSRSRSVRGSRPPSAAAGAGNAARSSFPLLVTGISSSTTTAAGTIASGNRCASVARTSSAASPAPTTYPISRGPRTAAAAARTPGTAPSALSTSPNSTR